MRVAIIAESFLPNMNGVTHSLLRVLDHLADRGDEVLVIAPGTRRDGPKEVAGARIVRVPSIALPKYRRVRVAPGGVTRIRRLLQRFAPDVVHLASPFVLGWRGVLAAQSLDLPTVAIYQTEVPAYAARYGMHGIEAMLWSHVRNIHQHASLTLAPSSYTIEQLRTLGVAEVDLWARGVDSSRFDPSHRSEAWRRSVTGGQSAGGRSAGDRSARGQSAGDRSAGGRSAGDRSARGQSAGDRSAGGQSAGGKKIIGYVGRLAAEKQVEDLAVLSDIPNAKLVIVGDGPWRVKLERMLPDAHFTGFLGGDALAQAVASFDVMVAPGELETFCQTIQEAMASEVPVIAPARGGPLDLVDSSRTGWLYTPKDLSAMREHTVDLLGDEAKRRAFGIAGRQQVLSRSWKSVCSQLIGHYSRAIESPAPQVLGRTFATAPRYHLEDYTPR